MAIARAVHRLEFPNLTVGEPAERDSLLALSQRKLNALGIPVAYIDRNQRYRFANRALLEWFGKRDIDVLGKEIIEVVGRDVYQLYRAYIDAALGGERTGFERQLVTAGRNPLWIRVDYYPDRSQKGQIRGFLATYTDVDQLKRLELEAGQREHRLRLVTDSVGVPILYFDRHLKLRFANRPCGDWVGAPADDLIGHALQEVLPEDSFGQMQPHIDRAFAGSSSSYERRERSAAGELRWMRITLFPDREIGGRVGGAFAVMHEIEDDIRIRDALKSQETQMRLFADNIPGPIAYLDRSLRYTFVNQAFANAVCKPRDEIYGKTPFEVVAAEVAQFLRPILEARASRRTCRIRACRYLRTGQPALAARARRARPGRDRRRTRCLLHRIRYP